jgi:hypothetical protein
MREGFYVEHARLNAPYPNSPLHRWAMVLDFYTLDKEEAVTVMERHKAHDGESDHRVIEVRVVARTP